MGRAGIGTKGLRLTFVANDQADRWLSVLDGLDGGAKLRNGKKLVGEQVGERETAADLLVTDDEDIVVLVPRESADVLTCVGDEDPEAIFAEPFLDLRRPILRETGRSERKAGE
jgi:hypothetical protein